MFQKNNYVNIDELKTSTVNDTFMKYEIIHDEVKDYIIYHSHLVVFNVTKADYSRYQCKAFNDLGADVAQITLSGRSM